MVTLEQKRRMAHFTAQRLEQSGLYEILDIDGKPCQIKLMRKPDEKIEHPLRINLILHADKTPVSELDDIVEENVANRTYSTHVIYQDGINFGVRLGERGAIKADDRSLKNYTHEQVNAMLHLRAIEKEILVSSGPGMPPVLSFYHEESERIPECIRTYQMLPVVLDYNHVDHNHRAYGFVANRESVDYKMLGNVSMTRAENPAGVMLLRGYKGIFRKITPEGQQPQMPAQ